MAPIGVGKTGHCRVSAGSCGLCRRQQVFAVFETRVTSLHARIEPARRDTCIGPVPYFRAFGVGQMGADGLDHAIPDENILRRFLFFTAGNANVFEQ